VSRLRPVKPTTAEQARQLADVMAFVDIYADALVTCRWHQNQESRREVERTHKALERAVLNVLDAAAEHAT
jgi:hypothetical protein